MPLSAASAFRVATEDCRWIFDFFAYGYDFLDGRYAHEEMDSITAEYELQWEQVERLDLIEEIAASDGGIPDALADYLAIPSSDHDFLSLDFKTRLYCCLLAIDRAAAGINYLGPRTVLRPKRWRRVFERILKTEGELVRRASGSVSLKPNTLVPRSGPSWWRSAVKKKEWEHLLGRGVHFNRNLSNLTRGQFSGCDIERKILPIADDLGRLDWTMLKIGVAPLIETLEKTAAHVKLLPGPLRIFQTPADLPRFSITMEHSGAHPPCAELCSHAESALREFARREVQIVVFPEMVVPDPVLHHIQEVLRDLRAKGSGYPGLVLAGSFTRSVLENPDDKPYNVAVLLNGNGVELCTQRKMHPYDMHSYESERFGITELFPGKFTREDIAFTPRQIAFVDSRDAHMRIAILICEDSAQQHPGVNTIKQLRANMVFIPVMAGALLSDGGFANTVKDVAVDPGGIVVVANSAALAREQWTRLPDEKKKVPHPPLAIVGLPLADTSSHNSFELLFEPIRFGSATGPELLIFQSPRRP